jgi:D-galactose 1-dehydrogenase
MAKYNIGIIGYGKIAHDQHVPAILASPDFELIAVSNGGTDVPPGDIKIFPTYLDMLKQSDQLDAIAICTPPGPRRSIAVACLRAGKHVLLEKPPAGTVAEVTDIAKCANEVGKTAFATYHAQHNAAVKRAADALSGKTIKTLDVTWKEDIRRWHPGQDWILSAGGLGIFDPGINAMSILTRIMPEAVFISASTLSFPANRQAPIAAELSFGIGSQTGSNFGGVLDWRQVGPPTWEIAVETTDGLRLKLTDGGSRLEIPGQPAFVGPPDEYPDIYREFASLLDSSQSKVEAAPFQLVADAFMLGSRVQVDAFQF